MPLYLLPNVFSDEQESAGLLPTGIQDICESLDGCLAESERSARRYLLKMNPGSQKMRTIPIYLLDRDANKKELEEIEYRLRKKGESWGILSDAGLSCIADPGSEFVLKLRKRGYGDIHAIPGPSSIFLALMLSGLQGQRFRFHGYLPREEKDRIIALKKLEKTSQQSSETQIWIEVPYRNKAMYKSAVTTLDSKTLLCIASHITFPDQRVETFSIEEWRKKGGEREEEFPPSLPTVFLLYR